MFTEISLISMPFHLSRCSFSILSERISSNGCHEISKNQEPLIMGSPTGLFESVLAFDQYIGKHCFNTTSA